MKVLPETVPAVVRARVLGHNIYYSMGSGKIRIHYVNTYNCSFREAMGGI